MTKDVYRTLRRHLHKQPIGYPSTRSGVEIRILKKIFTPLHASIALAMTHNHETPTIVHSRLAGGLSLTVDALASELNAMARLGAIYYKEDEQGARTYALVPLVVGMYEFQQKRLNLEFLADISQYGEEGFGLEFLLPHHPQFRVIPIEKSVSVNNKIASYESLIQYIKSTHEPIVVAPCICRMAKDMQGTPCQKTKRREVCLTFGDMARYARGELLGHEISKEEALTIARESEQEGLVLEASGEQQAQVICACCHCCCGTLSILSRIKRPSEYISTNYYAKIDKSICTYCGSCARGCQMGVIACDSKAKKIELSLDRCLGCGVCVPICKRGAIVLEDKPYRITPPVDTEVMAAENMRYKKNLPRRIAAVVRILCGMKRR